MPFGGAKITGKALTTPLELLMPTTEKASKRDHTYDIYEKKLKIVTAQP